MAKISSTNQNDYGFIHTDKWTTGIRMLVSENIVIFLLSVNFHVRLKSDVPQASEQGQLEDPSVEWYSVRCPKMAIARKMFLVTLGSSAVCG